MGPSFDELQNSNCEDLKETFVDLGRNEIISEQDFRTLEIALEMPPGSLEELQQQLT